MFVHAIDGNLLSLLNEVLLTTQKGLLSGEKNEDDAMII